MVILCNVLFGIYYMFNIYEDEIDKTVEAKSAIKWRFQYSLI